MDINDVQLVGGPCGQHGPYTFYKAFKYTKNGVKKIITLSEFFFVKMWRDSDLMCIGELQLLWTDKNSEQTLASLRLYFLPENTPEGRMDQGEDEVLAISEKVVIRLDDLVTWLTVDTEWSWGRLAKCEDDLTDVTVEPDQLASPRRPAGNSFSLSETVMDFSDVEQEREKFEDSPKLSEPHVIILSFPKYCRYRAMMRRLEGVENLYLKYKIVNALGGFYVKHPNTRVLFCKDTFDYPELEGHELLCNHLAPKLKGRPRGKRKKRSVSPGSESNESESSITNHFARVTERSNGINCSNSSVATRRSTRCHENNENKQFMKMLSSFMKAKRLPMGRIPSLGYKDLNLHEFYTRVQKLGGYECVTTNRMWKSLFDDMTGHLNSTSAATIIRRHYERFLLAFERHERGEEDKPLPVSERRRLKNQQASSSDSDSGTDTPSTSRSSSSPPVPSTENKEISPSGGKTSSLRSIRVKPERQKDKLCDKPSVSEDQNTSAPNQNTSSIIKTEIEDIKPAIVETVVVAEIIEEVKADEIKAVEVKAVEVKIEVEESPTTITQEVAEEIKEDDKPKSEPDEVKPSVPEGTKTEGSIPAEPITNAVAPIVTTIIPEQNLSPIEGKENIPVIKTGDIATISVSPKILNIAKTEPEDDTAMHDVKRMKLDILKEGGLEVTPVRSTVTPTSIKEFRPSVIQAPPNNFVKPTMAAPSAPLLSNVLPKRNHLPTLPAAINITQVKTPPTTPVKQQQQQQQIKPESFQFVNGATPPKVVQSRSIYSYSEKTVYGNPKDDFMVPHAPKSIIPAVRQSGGDPVDLSLTSPQKPAIQIMPVPHSYASNSQMLYTNNNRASVTKNLYKTTPPLLDGQKLSPNLEITLVGPKPAPALPAPASSQQRHSSHKRSGSETYAQKIAKLKAEEMNSRHSKYHAHKHSVDARVPSPFVKNSSSSVSAAKPDTIRHMQKPLVPLVPQSIPPYLASRFAAPDNSNGLNPFQPLMDSLYYQAALQNVYSNLSTMPPVLPIPTPEQLKFYAELMHGRLNNVSYSPHPDGHPSVSNNKKP